MKLRQAVKEGLQYPTEQAADVQKSLAYLLECSGDVGYHARRLKHILCEEDESKEEEPL